MPPGTQHNPLLDTLEYYKLRNNINTGNNSTIAIRYSSQYLKKGDEIGLFANDTLLFGASKVDTGNLAIIAWGNSQNSSGRNGFFENENIEEVFNKIVDEVYAREIDYDNIGNFKNPLKNLIYISNMHGQVLNGGVIQFVDNSTGDSFEETLKALKEIKATEYIEILEKVKSIFPKGIVPKDTEKRREVIDNIWESLNEKEDEEMNEMLEKLDEKYYDNQELLYKYIINYTKLNIK